jgi:hypothetical protein
MINLVTIKEMANEGADLEVLENKCVRYIRNRRTSMNNAAEAARIVLAAAGGDSMEHLRHFSSRCVLRNFLYNGYNEDSVERLLQSKN